jgi:hypothetical protein
MTLNETLDAVRRREQAQRLDQGEAEVLAKVAADLPQPPELDNETLAALQPWLAWTTEKNCRHAPAKPFAVSQFILDQSATGATTEAILKQVEAIARLHDKFSLPNPCATAAARAALEREFNFDVPRSWTAAEKQTFLTLPAEIRAAISRREQDRETKLRRSQNEAAELRKQLRLSVDGTDKPVETSEKLHTNGEKK